MVNVRMKKVTMVKVMLVKVTMVKVRTVKVRMETHTCSREKEKEWAHDGGAAKGSQRRLAGQARRIQAQGAGQHLRFCGKLWVEEKRELNHSIESSRFNIYHVI